MKAIQPTMTTGRGVVIVEKPDGTVVLEYAENSRIVFASAIHEIREFASFSEAINFLAMYDRLIGVQWWDHPLDTGLLLGAS